MSKNKNKKKDNFNQTMYEMFGIGKDTSVEAEAENDVFFGEEAETLDDYILEPMTDNNVPAAKPRRTQTTLLAEGTSIEGILRCDSDVEICGDFKGELIVNGKVIVRSDITSNVQSLDLSLIGCNLTGDTTVSNCITIDENATVIGNVTAQEVVCSGVVRGNINVTGNLTLNAKSRVFGDIHTASLVIERGARVSGKIEMTSAD